MIPKFTAFYKNGDVINVSVADGDGLTKYGDLKKDNLDCFNFEFEDRSPVTIWFEDEDKPIYRRRTMKRTDGTDRVLYVLGRQNAVAQSILFMFDDGTIHMTGKFREDFAPFCKPEWMEDEKVMVTI